MTAPTNNLPWGLSSGSSGISFDGAETVGPDPAALTRMHPSGACPNANVENAVRGLLTSSAAHIPEHWEQLRFAFVRPARLSFVRQRLRSGVHPFDSHPGDFETEFEVVTTDISRDGVGILCWDMFPDSLPQLVSLQIGGVVFDCEVRWREHIACLVYRFGLKLHDVLDQRSL